MPELGTLTRSSLPAIQFKAERINYDPPDPLPPDTTKASAMLGKANALSAISSSLAALPGIFEKSYKAGADRVMQTKENQSRSVGLELKNDILSGKPVSQQAQTNLQGFTFGADGSSTYRVPGPYDAEVERIKRDEARATLDYRQAATDKLRKGEDLVPNPMISHLEQITPAQPEPALPAQPEVQQTQPLVQPVKPTVAPPVVNPQPLDRTITPPLLSTSEIAAPRVGGGDPAAVSLKPDLPTKEPLTAGQVLDDAPNPDALPNLSDVRFSKPATVASNKVTLAPAKSEVGVSGDSPEVYPNPDGSMYVVNPDGTQRIVLPATKMGAKAFVQDEQSQPVVTPVAAPAQAQATAPLVSAEGLPLNHAAVHTAQGGEPIPEAGIVGGKMTRFPNFYREETDGEYYIYPRTVKKGADPKPIVIKKPNAAQVDDDVSVIADSIINGTQPPVLTGLYKKSAAVKAELARKGFDLSHATTDWQATIRNLATMNGPQQLRVRQAVDFTHHSLDIIEELGKKWKGGPSPILNRAQLELAKQGAFGKEQQSLAQTFEGQINDLVSELGTVYKGGNSSTDQTLKLAGENLKSNFSEKTFIDSVNLIRKNLQIRANSLNNVGVAGTSLGNPYAPTQGGPAHDAVPTPAAPTSKDAEAATWLKANPTHPKAAAIRAALKSRGIPVD